MEESDSQSGIFEWALSSRAFNDSTNRVARLKKRPIRNHSIQPGANTVLFVVEIAVEYGIMEILDVLVIARCSGCRIESGLVAILG